MTALKITFEEVRQMILSFGVEPIQDQAFLALYQYFFIANGVRSRVVWSRFMKWYLYKILYRLAHLIMGVLIRESMYPYLNY